MSLSYYPHIKILYRTFLGVNYAIYNKQQAGITLIVKSTTLFSNFSSLKSVSAKLCFRDGLARTLGLTVETKLLAFSSLSSVMWTRPHRKVHVACSAGVILEWNAR